MQQDAETVGWAQEAERQAARSSSPLRILMLGPSLDMIGGQARQAARLLTHLREEQSLEVTFMQVNPRLPGFLRNLQKIKYVRTVATTLVYWAKLLLKTNKYDVLHIFSASYYSYLLSAAPAILIGKLYGKKTILNYRSGEAEDHLRNWRWTARPTIRLAHMIVVPSGYLVDVFARFGLRASAIYNIIELDRFRYRERSPLRPVFLASRLLEPLYNVGCVLRAFSVIQKEFPEASLVVAGDGSERAALENLARELGLRNTEFIGAVPFEKMPEVYDRADIYLNAPNLDNMPSSITECLASGLLVVTTNAGGIPYIVKHEETCLMVERDDHEAMAAAAIRLLKDNDLASEIARRGLESCQKYRWAAVQNAWLSLYHELADDGSRAGTGMARNAVNLND
jgi:glycosyltransferase involved in cell wall biosynthesis